jgi:hypothetical protein
MPLGDEPRGRGIGEHNSWEKEWTGQRRMGRRGDGMLNRAEDPARPQVDVCVCRNIVLEQSGFMMNSRCSPFVCDICARKAKQVNAY